jgi:hypothetical protein
MEFIGVGVCFCQTGFGGQFCEQTQVIPSYYKDPCSLLQCRNGSIYNIKSLTLDSPNNYIYLN